jgi:hypothetical protein
MPARAFGDIVATLPSVQLAVAVSQQASFESNHVCTSNGILLTVTTFSVPRLGLGAPHTAFTECTHDHKIGISPLRARHGPFRVQ